MAILKNARTWVGGYDFTTDLNNIGLDLMRAELDDTRFAPVGQNGARARAAGIEDWAANHRGMWASGAGASVDSESFAGLGALDVPATMAWNGVEGESAYMLRGGSRFRYQLLGQHGRLAPFGVQMKGTTGDVAVVRGAVAKTRGDVSATGVLGSVLNLGNVPAGGYLYAALHVFAVGTTITVLVESDDAGGFASPTTRITLGPITAVGGYWGLRVAGPLTETHYRLNVSAITGTFNVAGLIGIR